VILHPGCGLKAPIRLKGEMSLNKTAVESSNRDSRPVEASGLHVIAV